MKAWIHIKPFVVRTIWIVLPIVLILATTEILITKVPNEYSQKSHFLESNLDSIEVLIFGPSVTLRGVNPAYFDSPTYNASLRGLDLELDELVIRKALSHENDVQHIILSITFNDFHHKARKLNASTLVYFSKYFGLPDLKLFISQERGIRLLGMIWKYYAHGEVMHTGIQENGFRVFPNKKPIFGKKAEKLAKSLNNQHPEYVASNIDHLKDIIDLCAQNDIHLTILNTPLHSSMRALLDQELVDELNEICGKISGEYEHVHHLNWMDHPAFEDSDFQDPIHLYEHGATKLSKLLNIHINQIE
ncbi:MAG: hypothetical protein R3275_13090 [Saprospiraceae bacterium]|nr:hypothetical protein [Saprospiraceae bacterium]